MCVLDETLFRRTRVDSDSNVPGTIWSGRVVPGSGLSDRRFPTSDPLPHVPGLGLGRDLGPLSGQRGPLPLGRVRPKTSRDLQTARLPGPPSGRLPDWSPSAPCRGRWGRDTG